jgi:hypothetical protein
MLASLAQAQDKMYLETKAITRTLECSSKDKLILTGERTFITLKTWDKNTILANVKIISKHKDQNQARVDLEKININLIKSGKKINYSNSINISDVSEKPKSNLKIELEIFIPENIEVEIASHFGKVDATGNYKQLNIESNFSKILLESLESSVNIITKYGDTSIDGYEGALKLEGDRSNIMVKEAKGEVDLKIIYGELEIHIDDRLYIEQIKAQYSPVKLHILNDMKKSMEFECNHCKIKSNDDNSLLLIKEDAERTIKVYNKGAEPIGSISSEVEDITIIFEKGQSN